MHSNDTVTLEQKVTAPTIFAGVVAFFTLIESTLSPEAKIRIWMWVGQLDAHAPTYSKGWPSTFSLIFDKLFGTRHLSKSCFLRSAAASYVALITLILLTPTELSYIIHSGLLVHTSPIFLPYFLLTTILANVLPDYLSLLKSRYLLGIMVRHDRFRFVLAGVDLVITFFIACAAVLIGETVHWIIALFLSSIPTMLYPDFIRSMLDQVPFQTYHVVRLGLRFGVGVLWFWPTFLTSIWLTFYIFSGWILKIVSRLITRKAWLLVSTSLDMEHQPLRSIGIIAGALAALIYWLGSLFL
jgi:hypothetical protein